MFQRVTKTTTLVVGSLESNTGSEFLFGWDPAIGLKWLERTGHEYGPGDSEWRAAEGFLRGADAPAAQPVPVEETVVAGAITRSVAQPQTVQRSVAADGWEDPYPMEGDLRIVGDTSTSGRDVPDEDIAAQAAQFLMMDRGEEE